MHLCIRQQLGNPAQRGGNQPCTDAVLWKRDTWGSEAMWQRPAKCGKVNFFKKKSLTFPDHHTEITEIAHVRHFFLANCQTSSSHFLWVPFTLGGRHQPRSLSSLSVWLSFVHFLPRLSTPDPVGGASAGSRQVEIRGGGASKPLMRYQWQVSVMWPEDCQYLLVSLFPFVDVLLIFWSMQIFERAFSQRM